MANKKKNKYPSKIQRPRRDGPINVKLGVYDGSTDDFVVSGHSSGSQNSEMDEISQQLSRDVGNVNESPAEMSASGSDAEYDGYEGEGLGDLGGPELYGNNPSLLKKSPIHFVDEARKLSIGTSIAALAGSAVLAGLAYAIYKNVKASDGPTASKSSSTSTAASARDQKVAAVKASVRTKAPAKSASKSKGRAKASSSTQAKSKAARATAKPAKAAKATRRSQSTQARA